MTKSLEVVDSSQVQQVAVIGAGTMGNGIAHVAALAGARVVLYDIGEEALAAAMSKIRANLDKGVSKGKVDAADRDAAVERLHSSTDLAKAVASADLVVEAVPEKLTLKQKLFAEIAAAVSPRTILATNTSSLPIVEIAKATPCPERVVGMHFFNPVHIMKLVEIVRHRSTATAVVQCAQGMARLWGKTPIVVTDSPGFASSRLGIILGLEAMRMVEAGVASAADVDTAMKLGYGHPMGPLELTDLVGLDVRLSIAEYLSGAIGEHFTPPEILRKKVAEGHLGKKSGQGFYRWENGKRAD
jgi:3-hydroxybutyryl-CoA dehydrogenase